MKCPKCSAQIKRFDLAPNCKKCGVHIMYYTQEEDLARDAKKTELEFTSARILTAKLKTAFIGGKIQIARIVFTLLAVAVLVLPSYNVKLSFPWWEYEISVGALGIYGMISDSFWQLFDSISSLGAVNSLNTVMIVSFALLALTALATVALFACLLFSFLNIKATAKGSIISAAVGILSQIASTVTMFLALNLSGAYEFIATKPLFGSVIGIAVLSVLLSVNIILAVNPPEVQLKDADKKRLEIKQKLKNGELTLDELPLPIVKEAPAEKENKQTKKNKKDKGRKKK